MWMVAERGMDTIGLQLSWGLECCSSKLRWTMDTNSGESHPCCFAVVSNIYNIQVYSHMRVLLLMMVPLPYANSNRMFSDISSHIHLNMWFWCTLTYVWWQMSGCTCDNLSIVGKLSPLNNKTLTDTRVCEITDVEHSAYADTNLGCITASTWCIPMWTT